MYENWLVIIKIVSREIDNKAGISNKRKNISSLFFIFLYGSLLRHEINMQIKENISPILEIILFLALFSEIHNKQYN